ncbi:MAG: hypothetical protein IJT94_16950 [Oscillibacter sp.]|nr:hypothetical protein [Oscillibacter sp.]
MAADRIRREARYLTRRNKRRFNRKLRRAWNNGGKVRHGTGKGGFKKNGECMEPQTMA